MTQQIIVLPLSDEEKLREQKRLERGRVVVRIKTEMYMESSGRFVYRKTMKKLERRSYGYDILNDDLSAGSTPDEIIERITNFHDVKDGVYELTPRATDWNWEHGVYEGFEYELTEVGPDNDGVMMLGDINVE